ncbi:MAG: Hemerythrin cation binding domain [Actinomycetota bacterium]
MQCGPLVGAVTAAHREVDARLTALEGAAAAERAARLAQLVRVIHATADAEEHVLFPALRHALGESNLLVETCAADHSEVAHRLDTLASHPTSPGFEAAISALARDVRNHMRDEDEAMVPLLDEALGEGRSAELAADFSRVLGGA